MGLWELFVIALGLSMDAFAVSICKGLSVRVCRLRHMLICGLYFGVFQALMPLIGYLLGSQFESLVTAIAPYIAFALCIVLVYACGLPYLYTAFGTFLICQGIARFLCGQLGGLTGDTYGFLTECGVVVYLMLATYLL